MSRIGKSRETEGSLVVPQGWVQGRELGADCNGYAQGFWNALDSVVVRLHGSVTMLKTMHLHFKWVCCTVCE